jgi:DNA-binding MarR family transcriptional regulator
VSDHPIHRLDDDVHQRVRLGVLACLAGVKRADFAFLRTELGLTDGNLGRHLEVLDAARLISVTKDTGDGRPRTWIKITRSGREALRREVEALQQILAAMPQSRDDEQPRDNTARTPTAF